MSNPVINPVEGQRYMIKYYPLHFKGYREGYKPARHPKWEELIFKGGRFMDWCGDYNIISTHTVKPEDVLDHYEEY